MILYTILFYFFHTFYIFTILCLITFFCLYKNIGRYDIKVVTGSANLCFQKINSILIILILFSFMKIVLQIVEYVILKIFVLRKKCSILLTFSNIICI